MNHIQYLYQILKEREKNMMQTMCFGGATPNLNRSLFEKQEDRRGEKAGV